MNHVLCSNLVHYECLVHTLYNSQNIRYIDFPIPIADRKSPLRIDIVCDNGSTWIKGIKPLKTLVSRILTTNICVVIARNPKSLSDTAYGRSGYGTKTILDQALEFIETAKENQYFFKPPQVIFEFAHKIDDDLAGELEEIGVVISQRSATDTTIGRFDPSGNHMTAKNGCIAQDLNDYDAIEKVDKLNLDVTTMLAYVSAMTNGSSNWEYQEPILTEQASWERKNPVKKILNSIFKGELYAQTKLNVKMLTPPLHRQTTNML